MKEITIEIVKENVGDIPEEELTKMKNNREEFAKLFMELYKLGVFSKNINNKQGDENNGR